MMVTLGKLLGELTVLCCAVQGCAGLCRAACSRGRRGCPVLGKLLVLPMQRPCGIFSCCLQLSVLLGEPSLSTAPHLPTHLPACRRPAAEPGADCAPAGCHAHALYQPQGGGQERGGVSRSRQLHVACPLAEQQQEVGVCAGLCASQCPAAGIWVFSVMPPARSLHGCMGWACVRVHWRMSTALLLRGWRQPINARPSAAYPNRIIAASLSLPCA